MNWLQNSIEPWSRVEQLWKDTYTYRASIDKDFNDFNKYPPLKQPLGYTLVSYSTGGIFVYTILI